VPSFGWQEQSQRVLHETLPAGLEMLEEGQNGTDGDEAIRQGRVFRVATCTRIAL
jgi:hypothetical protein